MNHSPRAEIQQAAEQFDTCLRTHGNINAHWSTAQVDQSPIDTLIDRRLMQQSIESRGHFQAQAQPK